MKIDFYGIAAKPPTLATAKAFGSSIIPIPLPGGQGTSFRSGDIILKPADSNDFDGWESELFNSIQVSEKVRFARPIKSKEGKWICEGYVAWRYLEGQHVRGEYGRKINASLAYHNLLSSIPKPDWLDEPKNPWGAANKVAWQEIDADYDAKFMRLINQITPHIETMQLPYQLIHGDLAGNFLLSKGFPPAIIDFSPAWAPIGFGEGVMLCDAIVWEDAELEDLMPFRNIPQLEQFAWRGALRRIAEQAEHITWLGKDKIQAISDAQAYQKAIDVLENNFCMGSHKI